MIQFCINDVDLPLCLIAVAEVLNFYVAAVIVIVDYNLIKVVETRLRWWFGHVKGSLIARDRRRHRKNIRETVEKDQEIKGLDRYVIHDSIMVSFDPCS
jgi:hypothetical protein